MGANMAAKRKIAFCINKLKSKKRKGLTEELAKLDPREERELADEFLQQDSGEWDEMPDRSPA